MCVFQVRLGDAHIALAEVASSFGQRDTEVAHLKQAMDKGYSKALTINRADPEALVGVMLQCDLMYG